MIILSRVYGCVFGAPSIHAVDPRIFRYRYFTHCMACGFCRDQCCSYGVDIDAENMARLKALGDSFVDFVGIAQTRWFEAEIEEDAEFPGGASGRTAVMDGACVFLDRKQRGCKIHAYCLANGLDYHHYKPLVSTLFPVTFEAGAITVSDEVLSGELICSGDGPALYDGVRGELEYYFGREFVAEIDGFRPAAAEEARPACGSR